MQAVTLVQTFAHLTTAGSIDPELVRQSNIILHATNNELTIARRIISLPKHERKLRQQELDGSIERARGYIQQLRTLALAGSHSLTLQ